MRDDVYRELVKVALRHETVTYKELARSVTPNLHPHYGVGNVIGEISEDQDSKGRPLISAITVLGDSETTICPLGHPSGGFFGINSPRIPTRLARTHYHYLDPLTDDHLRFIASEQVKVWSFRSASFSLVTCDFAMLIF